MNYKIPELDYLIAAIDDLERKYLENQPAPNDTRLELIRCIRSIKNWCLLQIDEEDRAVFLTGVLAFGMELVEYEYGFLAPEPRFFNKKYGGELYPLLKNCLQISPENPFSNEERFIFLANFYNIVKKHDKICWKEGQENTREFFLQSVKRAIRHNLKKLKLHINYLLSAPPDPEILKKNVDEVITDYRMKTKARWFKNPGRDKMVDVMECIQQSLENQDFFNVGTQGASDVSSMMIDYQNQVRRAIIAYVGVAIYDNHKILSPKCTRFTGSELYDGCLKALNIKHIDDIPLDDRIRLFHTLGTHIDFLLSQKSYNDRLNLAGIKNDLSQKIGQAEIKKNTPRRSEHYMQMAMSYATQYGIGFACANTATNYVIPTASNLIFTTAVATTVGPMATILYGTAGTIVASQIGQMIQAKIIDKALASAYSYVLAAIGDIMAQNLTPAVMLTVEVSATSLGKLIGFYQDMKKFEGASEENTLLIQALAILPDDVFSKSNKDILKHTSSVLNKTLTC